MFPNRTVYLYGIIPIKSIWFVIGIGVIAFFSSFNNFTNIVIEKEFRKSLSNYDWKKLSNKNVAVFCSADTILPKWAYMLIVSYLNKVDANAYFGEKKIVTNQLALDIIKTLDIKKYNQKIVLVKGCSDVDISSDLYVEITKLLLPVVKKLMFGEACSSVPIYMKKK